MQKREERISCVEDAIENIDPKDKDNEKCKKFLTKNIQEIQDTMRHTKSKDYRYKREQSFPT